MCLLWRTLCLKFVPSERNLSFSSGVKLFEMGFEPHNATNEGFSVCQIGPNPESTLSRGSSRAALSLFAICTPFPHHPTPKSSLCPNISLTPLRFSQISLKPKSFRSTRIDLIPHQKIKITHQWPTRPFF